MEIIFTFGIAFFVFTYFLQNFFKVPSYQLIILPSLPEKNDKVPKLLLKLVKINRDNVTWDNLTKEESKKVGEYYQKLEKAAWAQLTFLYNQNLVHIRSNDDNRFYPLDKWERELVHEEIGRIDKDIAVEYVLYRKKGGWFKTPILIGYLRSGDEYSIGDKKGEVEVIFEFPENLVKATFFTKGLENKFKLEKDVRADSSLNKNEFGDNEEYYYVNYDQEHKSGCRFHFLVA